MPVNNFHEKALFITENFWAIIVPPLRGSGL
jgi:hypothetical protein